MSDKVLRVKEAPDFVRSDDNPAALLNTNVQALGAYRTRKNKIKTLNERVAYLEQLVTQLLDRNNK